MASEPVRNKEEELHNIKLCVAQSSPSDFPLLVWSLFDIDGEDLLILSHTFDISVKAKLQHLPIILRSLREFSRFDAASMNFDQPANLVLERMRSDDRVDFEKAWAACRYGQRFECQAVDDLGQLEVLSVKDLLVVKGDDVDGESRASVLLRYLVDSHNTMVSAVNGEAKTISLYQAAPETIAHHIVPWAKAKEICENIMDLPQREPMRVAKNLESLLRDWFKFNTSIVKFSLDDWPKSQQIPAGIVRLPKDEQAASLPPDCVVAIEDFFRNYGRTMDQVYLALEVFKKIAMSVESSQAKISCETPLQDKISSFVRLPQSPCSKAPRLLQIFEQQTGKRLSLRIKHLNALQDFLSEIIGAKVEDVLCSAYRVPLDDRQLDHLRSIHSCQKMHLKHLLRKLLKLAEMLQRDAYSPKHGIDRFSCANCVGHAFGDKH